MSYKEVTISETDVNSICNTEENYFIDIKDKRISPAKLSESVSAFSNASGGEVYIGITEDTRSHQFSWDGYTRIEDANPIFSMLESLTGLSNYYDIAFLRHPIDQTYVIHITIQKSINIVFSTSEKIFKRVNAQNLKINTIEAKKRLELDKGIQHFENEPVPDTNVDDAASSKSFELFATNIIPTLMPKNWIIKQKLLTTDGRLNVAGTMLFCDEPQIVLPKHSGIKIFRYKTSGTADRDMLDITPLTIEGCAYDSIYNAVKNVKDIVEKIKKLDKGFETIQYPTETLHEIITNAVLHRDYSIATDIQIRIFDNRIEVESPGKLPGSVTTKNILDSQTARNPKIVRLINKFPNPPNKDVGEGLNTAFDAMAKLRLKEPEIIEKDASVLVIIKHEKLASPEDIVIKYLETHRTISNQQGRKITGIKSENVMKNVFYRLRTSGLLKKQDGKNLWEKNESI